MWSGGGIILTGENRITRTITRSSDTSSYRNPTGTDTESPRNNLSHGTAQSEGHNRCTLCAVQTEVALGVEQTRCWEDRQLLCERDDGACCYTGRHVGTECNSDTTAVNIATEHPTVPAQLLVATQPARRR